MKSDKRSLEIIQSIIQNSDNNSNNCLVANVIRADAEVTDAVTMSLLQALNVSYDTVRAITERGDR